MTLSLRGRLLIGVISLVAVGLLTSDVATYSSLESSLVGKIDEQLQRGSTIAIARALLSSPTCSTRGRIAIEFPGGTITELIAADGSVVNACGTGGLGTSGAAPVLPKSLPKDGEGKPVAPYTVA